MLCPMLDRSTQVLVRKSASSNNNDVFAPERQWQHLVGVAIHTFPSKLLPARPFHVPSLANSAVRVEANALAVRLARFARCQVLPVHVIGLVRSRVHLYDLGAQAELAEGELGRNREQVTHDVVGGRVVLIGPSSGSLLVHQAIPNLGGVHPGELVRIVRPDPADLGVSVEDQHIPTSFHHGPGGSHPRQASPHHDSVHLSRHRPITGANVW
mmetsp:Transcript_110679/g.263938  ORF Transcript_110679/g.263938 Transcript_110679/m.263938 type:complete len:212 (-) Transcript_110679:1233-1868(-)